MLWLGLHTEASDKSLEEEEEEEVLVAGGQGQSSCEEEGHEVFSINRSK